MFARYARAWSSWAGSTDRTSALIFAGRAARPVACRPMSRPRWASPQTVIVSGGTPVRTVTYVCTQRRLATLYGRHEK